MATSHSLEELDLLERSTKKKMKTSADWVETQTGDVVMETLSQEKKDLQLMGGAQSVDVVMQTLPTEKMVSNRSFRDTLMGNHGEKEDSFHLDDADFISDDEEMNKDEEEEDCLKIKLSREENARLRRPWRQTLIVKVLGCTVGYNYLIRRIKVLWHLKSNLELVAIDDDYFLAKFSSIDDCNFAKYEGPWMILDHYLIVKEWSHNFDSALDYTKKVLVWVRFPYLLIEYYDRDFLMKVSEKIRKPIRVDHTTSLVSRGKFAKLCVEVDITKPFLSKFKLRRKIRKIEYKGIHLVCFHYGVYGHCYTP
ncbi:hypothetical protein PTKIN_Ptkin11bG0116100 [Pterospermum kingtungense]